ncbi:MAG: hypothetical protein ABEL04_12355 [Salinibacter sp.]|uniref:hypothetical protein n=1 Tax=Salinibacter sp. TaxID=2065818 RepID=UPI0035D3DBA5
MALRRDASNNQGRGGTTTRFRTRILLALVALSVFVVGATVLGPGKFGWTVMALILSGLIYRYRSSS